MYVTWTESPDAVLTEQRWHQAEQERHQRSLHQLKTELRQSQRRRKQLVGDAVEIFNASQSVNFGATPITPSKSPKSDDRQ